MSSKNWKIKFEGRKQINKEPVDQPDEEEEKKAFVPLFDRAKV